MVDDGSTDGSLELVRRHPRVRVLAQENAGPGAARNLGTRSARGAIIAYTDADCILPPNWLKQTLWLHEQYPGTDAICGGILPARPLPYGSCILADHLCSWFDAHARCPERHPEALWGANMSVTRRVPDAGIWWSERRTTGEDLDISQKLIAGGKTIRFFPGHHAYHVDRHTLRGVLRHQYNWGFHAPFVRGPNKDFAYSSLFPPSVACAWLLSPVVVVGYTWLVIRGWWKVRPLGLLSAVPLIVLGKLCYARGVLHGTRALVSRSSGILADQRHGSPIRGEVARASGTVDADVPDVMVA